MRRVIVEVESVDQRSDGLREHGFLDKGLEFHSEDVQEYLDDLLFTPDALLMGQKTFHGFADLWPTQQGPAADRINSMPKYVASRTLKEPLTWNATLIKGDVAEEIGTLKQEPGKSLLQYGVGGLTATMLKAGLVDEFRILLHPFTFGQGPHIFEHTASIRSSSWTPRHSSQERSCSTISLERLRERKKMDPRAWWRPSDELAVVVGHERAACQHDAR